MCGTQHTGWLDVPSDKNACQPKINVDQLREMGLLGSKFYNFGANRNFLADIVITASVEM